MKIKFLTQKIYVKSKNILKNAKMKKKCYSNIDKSIKFLLYVKKNQSKVINNANQMFLQH